MTTKALDMGVGALHTPDGRDGKVVARITRIDGSTDVLLEYLDADGNVAQSWFAEADVIKHAPALAQFDRDSEG